MHTRTHARAASLMHCWLLPRSLLGQMRDIGRAATPGGYACIGPRALSRTAWYPTGVVARLSTARRVLCDRRHWAVPHVEGTTAAGDSAMRLLWQGTFADDGLGLLSWWVQSEAAPEDEAMADD